MTLSTYLAPTPVAEAQFDSIDFAQHLNTCIAKVLEHDHPKNPFRYHLRPLLTALSDYKRKEVDRHLADIKRFARKKAKLPMSRKLVEAIKGLEELTRVDSLCLRDALKERLEKTLSCLKTQDEPHLSGPRTCKPDNYGNLSANI